MRPRRFAADHTAACFHIPERSQASMRPRRFAADHAARTSADEIGPLCFNEAAAFRRGSRARPLRGALRAGGFNEAAAFRRGSLPAQRDRRDPLRIASMRPRRFAADHPALVMRETLEVLASMRPRRFAADHGLPVVAGQPGSLRFNEAAAFRRGSRPSGSGPCPSWSMASMRPRRFAADHRILAQAEARLDEMLQ